MTAKDVGVYGSGMLYSEPAVINPLRTSGMTTVVAWALHVSPTGDLIYNDKTIVIVRDGRYVGAPQWPELMQRLKVEPTSVKRLLFSIGGWKSGDYKIIRKLIKEQGTGPKSILYRNFAALKKTIPGIDGIDFDDEELYDPGVTIPLALMLHEIGFTVTFCPYTELEFWVECLAKLNGQHPGLVSGFNLQCYSGGEDNEPGPWIEAVAKAMGSGFDAKSFVRPGLWARHGDGCQEGECPDVMRTKIEGWSDSSGIVGAWVWMLDELWECWNSEVCRGPITAAAYAEEILAALNATPEGA
jgi:hypothetical protein